jgi:hypothetical protein
MISLPLLQMEPKKAWQSPEKCRKRGAQIVESDEINVMEKTLNQGWRFDSFTAHSINHLAHRQQIGKTA